MHQRSLKLAVAARQLDLAVSTVGLMAKRGELDRDPETDSSGASFITRASVERARIARSDTSREGELGCATVPLADVVRFTGRSRTELLDLVHAGILEQLPRRGPWQLTAASVQTWVIAIA